MRLIEAIPTDYQNDFINFKAFRFKDVEVKETITDKPWPKENRKNVIMWFKLKTGRIVGINESPQGDISFPTKDFANLIKPFKKVNKPRKMKNKKRPTYIRVGTLTPEEFFAIEEPRTILFGHKVKMHSHRYTNFRVNGLTCKHCGITGTFFALEKNYCNADHKRAHFNLYGFNESGDEVMLTKDHILPKAHGGKDHIDNYQVLCTKCNTKKGSKIEK